MNVSLTMATALIIVLMKMEVTDVAVGLDTCWKIMECNAKVSKISKLCLT